MINKVLDLDCPDPDGCPVAAQLPPLRTVSLAQGTDWYRVYDATWGYDEHNPGHGDARFSPIDDPKNGQRLPSMYLAQTPTAALLETVFHSVHQSSPRLIYERDLRGKLLAYVRVRCRMARRTDCNRVGRTGGRSRRAGGECRAPPGLGRARHVRRSRTARMRRASAISGLSSPGQVSRPINVGAC